MEARYFSTHPLFLYIFCRVELHLSSLFIFTTNGTTQEPSRTQLRCWSIELFVQTTKGIVRCFSRRKYMGKIHFLLECKFSLQHLFIREYVFDDCLSFN